MLIASMLTRSLSQLQNDYGATVETTYLNPPVGDDRYAGRNPTPSSNLLRPSVPLVNLIPTAPAVLNADRPISDTPSPTPAATPSGSEMASHIAQLPAMNTTAKAPFDWKKYLPWIIAAVVILVILAASRRKSAS